MDIIEKIDYHLNEKVNPKDITKISNEITNNMKKLGQLVEKSDAFPDLKKSFKKQSSVVFDEWLRLFDITTDIVQMLD